MRISLLAKTKPKKRSKICISRCEKVEKNGLIKEAGPCYVMGGNYCSIVHRGVYVCTSAFLGALHHAICKKTYHNLTPTEILEYEGSHRCGNKGCVVHVCLELHPENCSQVGCRGFILNSNYADGTNQEKKYIPLCQHSPHCCFFSVRAERYFIIQISDFRKNIHQFTNKTTNATNTSYNNNYYKRRYE